jgi:hypothetical protein
MISPSDQDYITGWNLAVTTLLAVGIAYAKPLLNSLRALDDLTCGAVECLKVALMNNAIPDRIAIASFF